MAYKIALASTDGKVVNQHFGHVNCFLIAEITENEYNCVELRAVPPCCNGGGKHETATFDAVLELLHDVQAIIVSRIGPFASNYLERAGKIVYEAPYPIEPLLQKMIKDKLYEVDKW
jgi:predicted Fe-Mo cluster-binding NifX family protein